MIENVTQGAALPSPICASIDIFPVKGHVEINEVELFISSDDVMPIAIMVIIDP